MCHPCFVKFDYIAKLETIGPDFQFIGKLINNKNTDFPDKSLEPVPLNYKEKNYTEVFIKYYSTVKNDPLNRLRKLYELDFKLFGYEDHGHKANSFLSLKIKKKYCDDKATKF